MKWLIGTLSLALSLHLVGVYALPYLIMHRVMGAFEQQAGGVNRMIHTPPSTHLSRTIVKPSPDLLYSVCVYDVIKGDVKITVPPYNSYISVAVYQANSDNFLISAKDILLTKDAPSQKGIVLIRYLVQDEGDIVEAKKAQSKAKCEIISMP
jgi:uncharacterized membrane protein